MLTSDLFPHPFLFIGIWWAIELALFVAWNVFSGGLPTGDMSDVVDYMNDHRENRTGKDTLVDAQGPAGYQDPEVAHVIGTVDERPDWMEKG